MNGIAVLVSLAAVGIDYGWRPTADGQLEYIIQIEPSLLEGLRNGQEIASEILPEARGVRKFRIRVGTGEVPRIGQLPDGITPRSLSAPNRDGYSTSAGNPGTPIQPLQNDWGSTTAPLGNRSAIEGFRPDGFLNLPPPPPLLSADGKNSVLVRPSREATSTGSRNMTEAGVLPPATGAGSLDLAAPPVVDNVSGSGRGWQESVTGPNDAYPTGGGVFPPNTESSFPAAPGGMVLPPSDLPSLAPPNERPVRPVPSPSPNVETPNPVRFGQSGIRPPGADGAATHGPLGPTLSGPANGGIRGSGDLLARAREAESEALQKPAISDEAAEQLTPKPWKPLVLTSLALFASLAANVYLGWVALGIYRRYRDMVGQLHQAQASLT